MDPSLLQIRRDRARLLAEALAEETGIPSSSILGRSRDPEVVPVRHRLWRMLWDAGLSMSALGEVCGVDHTTIRAALRKQGLATARPRPAQIRGAA